MTFESLDDHPLHPFESTSALSDDPVPSVASQAGAPDSAPSGYFLSEIPAQPLTWLWCGRIPLGHLTLLDAAPGCGLSLFALNIAANVSRGAPLPGDTITPPANVILLTPYDSPSQTIRPRLEAACADLTRIFLFSPSTPSFSFPADLDRLAATIRRLNARLVILDPAGSILGLTRCLPALADLARQTNCAILLTRSLRQAPTDPLHASAPASPLLNAARSRLLLTPDPQDDRRLLLLTTRHPLCARPAILAYDLQVSESETPSLHWLGEYDETFLTHPGTGHDYSLNREAILRFLQQSEAPCEIEEILAVTLYGYQDGGYEAGRKMLQRMRQAGDLVSPARGLYTTSNHPCLASSTGDAAVPDVPDTPSSFVSSIPAMPDSSLDVPTIPGALSFAVPNNFSPSIPADSSDGNEALSDAFSVPNVPISDSSF